MPAGLLDSLKAEFTPVFLDKAPLLSGHVRRDAVGRPIAVKESEAWVERADADALRAILALSMPAQGQVLTSGAEEELALLKDATFMRSASKPWWIPIQGIDASADSVSMPKRVKFVAPHYPTKARDARHEGSVAFDIVVDQLGDVSEIRVRTASDRSFVNAALMAVMQWKYTPAKVSGTPVDMFMTVIVSFDLG